MKKTTLALGMHDKLFKRARTMLTIISLIKMEILLAYVLILPVKSGA